MTTFAPTLHEVTALTPPPVRHLSNRNPSPARPLPSPGSTQPAGKHDVILHRRASSFSPSCIMHHAHVVQMQFLEQDYSGTTNDT
ncbi:hypothetical protein NHX12_021475 [Muraenolepis orangiensis]|uniref:Uncharacterized protein n=1 Tax=Muraenolepis orangiensis TaxID=630683 RepID=A0A9Q0EQ53_9TELE|nr:hypothetical protein NHX12_021475 [Muraenolepis orangiensis]